MKKRTVMSLLCAVLVSCSLTACSMPDIPFLNKDKDTEVDGTEEPSGDEVASRLTVNEGLTFNVGDIITFDDLATVNAADVGNVTQFAIFNSDGTLAESYECTEPGTFSINMAVQFLDGTSDTGVATIEVVEKEVTSDFPDALNNSIMEEEWTVKWAEGGSSLDGLFEDSNTTYNGMSFVISLLDAVNADFGSMGVWRPTVDSKLYVSVVHQDAVSGIRASESIADPTVCSPILYNTITKMQGMAEGYFAEDQENMDKANSYIALYKQVVASLMSATPESTDMLMYTVDGESYPVEAISYRFNFSAIGGADTEAIGMYVVRAGDELIFITDGYGDLALPTPQYFDWITALSSDGETEFEVPADAEAFKAFMAEHLSESGEWAPITKPLSQNVDESKIKDLCNKAVIGDVTPLRPTAPPENDISTAPEGEEPTEEQDTVADTFKSYAQLYPGIFTWPENDTKYRRWVYVIDESTQFVSSIINPDGTSIISGVMSDDDWRIETNTGNTEGSTPGGEGGSGMSEGKTYQLNSSYSTFELNMGAVGAAAVDEEKSTSGRAVINYNGAEFYIETVRTSQIQNYVANSLYDTSKFKDGAFRVVEGKKTTTNIGEITQYDISYKDANGNEKSAGYMAVYNVKNDYLCCYSGLMQSNSDTYAYMLQNLVNLK